MTIYQFCWFDMVHFSRATYHSQRHLRTASFINLIHMNIKMLHEIINVNIMYYAFIYKWSVKPYSKFHGILIFHLYKFIILYEVSKHNLFRKLIYHTWRNHIRNRDTVMLYSSLYYHLFIWHLIQRQFQDYSCIWIFLRRLQNAIQ